MADTNIVKGLFGITPDELIAQRDQAQQARAMQFAQIAPEAQSSYLGYRAGTNIGTGLAGLMGAQDPELMRVTKLNSLLKDIDPTSAEGLAKAATVLAQNGFQQEAMQAAAKAQAMQEQAAKIKYEEARATAATNPLGRINPQMYTPESLAKYKQSLDIGDLVLVEKAQQAQSMAGKLAQDRGFKPGTPEFTNEVAKIEAAQQAEKQAKAQQVKAMPASIRKEVDALQEQVDVFSNNISDVSNIVKLLDENKVKFSPGDNLESFLRTVFNNSDEASRVKSDLRSSVEGMRNAILQGNKGTQTEGDAQRAADEILSAIDKNDTATVYRRLQVLQTKFDRAMQQRKKRLDNYYSAYGEKTPGGADIAPEAAPMQATTPAATQAPKFSGIKTPLDVRAAVKAGNMSREDAKAILKDMEAQGIFK